MAWFLQDRLSVLSFFYTLTGTLSFGWLQRIIRTESMKQEPLFSPLELQIRGKEGKRRKQLTFTDIG